MNEQVAANKPVISTNCGISRTYYGGTPGWVRTSGFQLRRLTLYPLSYGRIFLRF